MFSHTSHSKLRLEDLRATPSDMRVQALISARLPEIEAAANTILSTHVAPCHRPSSDLFEATGICHIMTSLIGVALALDGVETHPVLRFLPKDSAYPCYVHTYLVTENASDPIIIDGGARQFLSVFGTLPFPATRVLTSTVHALETTLHELLEWRTKHPEIYIIDDLLFNPEICPFVYQQGEHFYRYMRRIWLNDFYEAPQPTSFSFLRLLREGPDYARTILDVEALTLLTRLAPHTRLKLFT